MKTKFYSFVIFIALFSYKLSSQNLNPFGVNTVIPAKIKASGEPNKYQNIDEGHLTYLQLFSDSSFAYYDNYSTLPDKQYFSFGKYSLRDSLLILNWDSLQTNFTIADTSLSKKYYKSGKAHPLKISNTKYVLRTGRKKYIEQPISRYKKLELFFSSKDVYSNGYFIDSIKFPYGMDFNCKKNKLIIKTHAKIKRVSFPLDSIWGWRYYFPPGGPGSYSFLVRTRGTGACGGAGIPIYQFDKIIVYEGSGGKIVHQYFSKTPDSEIFPLSIKNLKEVFKDNPYFLESLDKEKPKDLFSYNWVDFNRRYWFVDLYKKSLEKK